MAAEWAILLSVSGSASLMTASSAVLLYTAWPLPAGQHVYINTLPQTRTLSPPNQTPSQTSFITTNLAQQNTKYFNILIHYQPSTMKFAAVSTLLFATLALASPAAQPQPEAAATVAQPLEIAARDPAPVLEARKKKPSGSSGNNNTNSTGAADMLAPSRALQLGALGLGVMQITKLW